MSRQRVPLFVSAAFLGIPSFERATEYIVGIWQALVNQPLEIGGAT